MSFEPTHLTYNYFLRNFARAKADEATPMIAKNMAKNGTMVMVDSYPVEPLSAMKSSSLHHEKKYA